MVTTTVEVRTPTDIQRPKGAPTIDATSLGTQSELTIPEPVRLNSAQNTLGATVEPTERVETPDAPEPQEEPQRPQDALVERILGNIEQARTRGERTDEILEAEGVLAKREAVDGIQDEIRRRDAFYRRQEEDLMARGGGLQGGAQAELNTLRRNRNRELADLRIQEQASLQAFETANAIAQQKIEAEFEPLQEEIQNLTTVFNLMQNDLSESEKMQVQAKIDEKKMGMGFAQASAQAVYNQLFEAGAASPERLAVVSKAMAEASTALENGRSPMNAIQQMQSALSGVTSLAQQQFALQAAQFAWQKEKYGQDLLRKAMTESKEERKAEEAALKQAEASIPVMQDKIELIDALKIHEGMTGSVGAYAISRFTPFDADKAERREFVAGVEKLVSGLSLDSLIQAKERGATFGALSDSELQILANAATAIGSWKIEKDGRVVGYEVGEAEFKRELDTIKEFTERAIRQSGGNLFTDEEDAMMDAIFSETNDIPAINFYGVQ